MTVLVLAAFYKQTHPEWKIYQEEFKQYLDKTVSTRSASAIDVSVKQIWLPELARVDRCISCHLGYDNPNLINAPQPFTAHPDINPHSVQTMGCTICHGGQGFALKKDEAHGEIEHWEKPLLGKKLAEKYGFKNQNALIQINCNTCHRHDADTPGIEMVDLAKKLLGKKPKCQTCHIINGKGSTVGPDLTFVGDKSPERVEFSKIRDTLIASGRPLTMLNWHFEHFMNPKAVVADSKMPSVQYSKEEAWSLALLMMSWRNISLPIMLMPKEKEEVVPSDREQVESEKPSLVEWGELLFESKNCSVCHTIGGGVDIGPDLKGVTKVRDMEWLKRVILNPEEMERSDPLVKKLYEEYGEVGMSPEDITEEEAEAILEYLASID
jgi:mono/diheme cytochrome c family protein